MISKPLVSVADVRPLMAIRAGDEDYDDRIRGLIAIATQQIETATGRKFTRQEFTQVFPTYDGMQVQYDFGSPGNVDGVLASFRPIRYNLRGCEIQTSPAMQVFYDPREEYGADTLREDFDYMIRPTAEQGYIELRFGTAETPAGLKVIYTAGYEVDTDSDTLRVAAPEDLRYACVLQTIFLFNRLAPSNIGIDIDRGEGATMKARFTSRGLAPEVGMMLVGYRQPRMGRV